MACPLRIPWQFFTEVSFKSERPVGPWHCQRSFPIPAIIDIHRVALVKRIGLLLWTLPHPRGHGQAGKVFLQRFLFVLTSPGPATGARGSAPTKRTDRNNS